jgi:hypothetical protein
MATNTNHGPLSALLASIPEAERPRWEQLAEAIIVEAREQLDDAVGESVSDAIEDVVGKAVEDAVEEIDFEDMAEDALRDAFEDYDIQEDVGNAIERAMRDIDFDDAVDEAVTNNERLQEIEQFAEKFDKAESVFESVSKGGFLRRLRWLLTGRKTRPRSQPIAPKPPGHFGRACCLSDRRYHHVSHRSQVPS